MQQQAPKFKYICAGTFFLFPIPTLARVLIILTPITILPAKMRSPATALSARSFVEKFPSSTFPIASSNFRNFQTAMEKTRLGKTSRSDARNAVTESCTSRERREVSFCPALSSWWWREAAVKGSFDGWMFDAGKYRASLSSLLWTARCLS
jgi:hypothetical protein